MLSSRRTARHPHVFDAHRKHPLCSVDGHRVEHVPAPVEGEVSLVALYDLFNREKHFCRTCKKSVMVSSVVVPRPSRCQLYRLQKSVTVRSVDSYRTPIENTASMTHSGNEAYSYAASNSCQSQTIKRLSPGNRGPATRSLRRRSRDPIHGYQIVSPGSHYAQIRHEKCPRCCLVESHSCL